MADREWILNKPDKEEVANLQKSGFSRVLSSLLVQRGFSDPQKARNFLSCNETANNALLMKDMESAAARIAHAVRENEKITVYGDYDADGVTATALLYSYLKEAGADAAFYIPERESEGYGLNAPAMKKIAEDGTKVIVTVDTGISAHDEAVYASSLGLCLVVTDHHEPRETLQEAYAVVNPKRKDCGYPYKELAGVGVAFKVVCAVEAFEGGFLGGLKEDRLFQKYGDLVCLGTVADVVPLTGENRLLVNNGLKLVSAGGNMGLSALLEVAGIRGRRLTANLLSFTAAPRINACGRISSACDALELLLAREPENAEFLAKKLDDNNRERREIEAGIFEETVKKINGNEALRNNPLLIVSGEGWHNGVIGIVASRLVELYGKPAVVISFEGDVGRASCRSISGFNIHEALISCSQYLERFGGHELAAGFTVKRENYDALYASLNRLANALPEPPTLKVQLDLKLRGSEVSLSTAREVKRLEPFGSGNSSPLFYIPAAQITALSPVGTGHMRLILACEGFEFTAVLFGAEKAGFDFKRSDIVDLAVSLDVNLYKNNETLSVIVRQIRKSECFGYYHHLYETFASGEPVKPDTLRLKLAPTRDEFAAVYRFLHAAGGSISLETACKEICLSHARFNLFKLLLITDVFAETGLVTLTREVHSDSLTYELNSDRKVNLNASSLLKRLA